MLDCCACYNKCSSEKSQYKPFKKSFSKRLLVAVSILVVLSVCVMPTSARAMDKRRHQRKLNFQLARLENPIKSTSVRRHTKSTIEIAINRQSKNSTIKDFTKMIIRQLKNTRRYFNQDRKMLNEPRAYNAGNPSWLPKVNFVNIHDHDYRNPHSNKTFLERRFEYLVPKLYKSLREYQEIFQVLKEQNDKLHVKDNPFYEYKLRRKDLLANVTFRLTPLLNIVTDKMFAMNVSQPTFDARTMDLQVLEKAVDATQCLKNDYIAFRGYGHLLDNWYSELNCTGKKLTRSIKCKAYTNELERRRRRRKLM